MTDTHPNSSRPPASIVVVSYNTSAHIEACLLSLMELDYPQVEIIVVDNASVDGSPDLIRSHFPDIDLIELPDNKGFAGGASVGLYMATGEIVATVNPDVRLHPTWMAAMADTLQSSQDIGVVGSKILYPDGRTIQHAGGLVHYPLATTDHIGRGEPDNGQYDHPNVASFVTGAALAMRREVGRSLGFFDDEYFPLYYEDVDLCWRANKEGLRVIYQPHAIAYHKESVTMDRKGSLYHSYYHLNRLRFVVKQYSPEQVLLDFLPAEAMRVTSDMTDEDRKASLSLLDNRLGTERNAPTPLSTARKLRSLQTQTSEVMSGWQVYEQAHPKKRRRGQPIGSRLGNLLSRWYLWPVLKKQIDYNASVARSLREMSRQLQELQARVALQSMLTAGLVAQQNSAPMRADMTEEFEELEARLEELEKDTGGLVS
jgi:GT2 family glycosyltransferase